MISPDDYYHVGVLAPDLEEAASLLTAAFGVQWSPMQHWDQPVHLVETGETRTLPFDLCFSLERVGGPRFELSTSIPGTIWEVDRLTWHHVGYWADDVGAAAARLSGMGHEIVAHDANDAGRPDLFSYHRASGGGPLLEYVSSSIREQQLSALGLA